MLFFKSQMLVGSREGDGPSEGGREAGGGWRGGDEWEWWVYWVLSGWVDGG